MSHYTYTRKYTQIHIKTKQNNNNNNSTTTATTKTNVFLWQIFYYELDEIEFVTYIVWP